MSKAKKPPAKVVKPVKAWAFQYEGVGGGKSYLVWFAEATKGRCWKAMSDSSGNRPTTGKPIPVLIVPATGYTVTPKPLAGRGKKNGK